MSITVKNAEPHNLHALKKIWKQCFGDSDDYINAFFEKGFKPEYSIIALYDMKPVGMMYTLPAMMWHRGKEYLGEYLYAVAVKPDYRNIGVMRAMEEKAVELARKQGLSFISLVPEHADLCKMYEKLGYRTAYYNYIRTHMPFRQLRTDNVSIRPCDRMEFSRLREVYLHTKKNYIDFLPPYDDYRYSELQSADNKIMLAVVDGTKYYFAGFKRGNIFLIKETSLAEADLKRILPLIANEFDVDIISVRGKKGLVDSITPYAMYKSLDNEVDANAIREIGGYVNLMLD